MTVRVFQVPSPKHYAGRSGSPVIALVHHRMVGTLKSTDSTFTTGTRQASTNFGVGYDCGRAGHPTGLAGAHVHQYVDVDDAAWGNGNLDATGEWDDIYGATPNPNFRTISIEHHDNGGAAAGSGRKGVVPPEVLAVSIELDRLLLAGDWGAWKAAGIHSGSDVAGAAIADQVGRIVPGPRTLVDHHFISGRLKPSCWRPWADDPTGFPQARYIAELGEEEDVNLTRVKVQAWTAVGTTGNLRTEPVRTLAPAVTLPAGTVVYSYGEWVPGDGHSWRAVEWPLGSAKVMWLIRYGPGVPADHDFLAGPMVPIPGPKPIDCAPLVNAARQEGVTAGLRDGARGVKEDVKNEADRSAAQYGG